MANPRAQVEVSLKDATQQGVQSAKRNMDMLSQSVKATASLFAGISIGAGLKDFSAAVLDARVQYEKLNSIMAQAVGSNRVGAELEFVRGTVSRLGMEFNSTALEYAKFSAASRGTSMEGAQTREIFTGIAMAAAQLGMSAEESSGAMLAIQQMMSKGKVSAEELRGQLGERLPGAFQIAARAMGMTTGELDKLMASGNLAAGDFLPRFAQQLQSEFSGALETAANKTQTSLNRMSNAWEDFKRTIANGAAGDAAVSMLRNLSVNLENASDSMRRAQSQATTLWEKLSVYAAPIPGIGMLMGATRERLAEAGQYDEGERARMATRASTGPAAQADAIRQAQEADAKATAEQQKTWRTEWDKLAKQYRSSDQKRADSIKEVKDLAAKLGEDPSKLIAGIQSGDRSANAGINKAKREAEQYRKLLDDLKSEINGVDAGFNEQLKMRFDLYSKGEISIEQYRKSVDSLVESQTELGRQSVRDREEAEASMQNLIAEADQRGQLADRFRDLIDPTRQYYEQLKQIQELVMTGDLGAEEAVKARAKIEEQLQGLKKSGDETNTIFHQMGMTFSSAFENAVVGGKGLRAVFDGLAEDITRVAFRFAIIKPMMDAIDRQVSGNKGSGSANMWDGLIGGIAGMFAKREGGGPVQKGVPYIVGERRPELFVPDQNGRIIPKVPELQAAGGGGSWTINVHATGSATHAEVYNAAKMAVQRAQYEQMEREART